MFWVRRLPNLTSCHVRPPVTTTPKMVNPEKDAPERFQAEVSKLKDEFNALDKEVRAGGKSIVRGIGQMIPALAQMEPFLSRKGEHHEPHYVKMLIAAGLPSWEDYKKQVAAEFEMSVRTVQRKLEEHRGYPREHQPRRLADGNGSRSAGEARPAFAVVLVTPASSSRTEVLQYLSQNHAGENIDGGLRCRAARIWPGAGKVKRFLKACAFEWRGLGRRRGTLPCLWDSIDVLGTTD